MSDPHRPLADVQEAELVQMAQQRDEAAFEELMHRNARTSFRLALSVLKDRQDAEDEVQNSFFSAWKRLSTFQFESRFSTWFRTIVLNQSLMRLRSVRRASLRSIDESENSEQPREYATGEPTAEENLRRSEMASHLREETERLPVLFRDVIILRDFEEKSIEEIADRLGISQPAVKSRLARARPLLKERMERHISRSSMQLL